MRPGPSRSCASKKPAPSGPSRFVCGTRTPRSAISEWLAQSPPGSPITEMLRTISKPGVARRHEDLRSARVRRRIGIGHRHHDADLRAVRAGGEPLATVDDVVVSFCARARAEPDRIRSRVLGLRHAEAAAHLAARERPEPVALLLVGPEVMQELHVPDVGRLAVHDVVRDRRATAALRSRRRTRRASAARLRATPEETATRARAFSLRRAAPRATEASSRSRPSPASARAGSRARRGTSSRRRRRPSARSFGTNPMRASVSGHGQRTISSR